MHTNTDTPRLFPWYVHIFGGWAFGGLFPWFLVISQFYKRKRKKTACALALDNLLFFIAICAFGFLSHLPWDSLAKSLMIVGMTWSFSAWLVQRTVFGEAQKRYYLKEWRNWIAPVISAVLIGVGISVFLSTLPLISDRLQMYQSRDLLTKNLILWDFFRFTPLSVLISLPLGLWWAGERERFSPSFIIVSLLTID